MKIVLSKNFWLKLLTFCFLGVWCLIALGDSMDFKVSKKERRWQPEGQVDVLVSNVCDLFPVFADDPRFRNTPVQGIPEQDKNKYIVDVEILDNARDELLDRAMFAVMKQRGNDPTEPEDGIQWAEIVLGEVPTPMLLQQVSSSVSKEGSGVKVTSSTVKNGTKENLIFKVELCMGK